MSVNRDKVIGGMASSPPAMYRSPSLLPSEEISRFLEVAHKKSGSKIVVSEGPAERKKSVSGSRTTVTNKIIAGAAGDEDRA